jgi:hypothetical protein
MAWPSVGTDFRLTRVERLSYCGTQSLSSTNGFLLAQSETMFTSTVVLTGTVVIEGIAFHWSVTDGLAQQLTVSHRLLGTQTQRLTTSPESQARAVGRAMLEHGPQAAATGLVAAFDDAPMPDGDPNTKMV